MRVQLQGEGQSGLGNSASLPGLQAPSRRPDVPRWRWIAVMMVICSLMVFGALRVALGLLGVGNAVG
jgi:hypothetical protein